MIFGFGVGVTGMGFLTRSDGWRASLAPALMVTLSVGLVHIGIDEIRSRRGRHRKG